MGDAVFASCTSLERITFPSTLAKISERTFFNCRSLTEIELHEGIQNIESDAFRSCSSLEYIVLPSTASEVGDCAFEHCTSLKKVVLQEGIQKIEKRAFHGCTSLDSIKFPFTVTEISERTFLNCPRLREVGLHEGIQKIDVDAFEDCSSLERFTFPNLSTRLNTITRAGQREVEDKIDNIRGNLVERRDSELFVSAVSVVMFCYNWKIRRKVFGRIDRLIAYYELKEATTLLELAMWRSKIDQAEARPPINRDEYRLDIPGPVKDTILQYLLSSDDSEDSSSSSSSSSSSEDEDDSSEDDSSEDGS